MRRSGIGVLLIGCLVLFWGCGARWERTPIVDNAEIYVSLERRVHGEQDGSPVGGRYDHPFAADADRLARFFSELRYKEAPRFYGEAQNLPVFQPIEIRRLAPALAAALAKANPDQRVRFVSYNRGGGLIFKKMRRTGGLFFIDSQSRLNLAFGYINHEIMDEELLGAGEDKPFTDPLSMEAAEQTLMVSSDAVDHRTQNGDKMPLWLTAEAELLSGGGKPAFSRGAAEDEKPAGEPAAGSQPSVADEPAGEEAWQRQREAVKKKLEYFKELHEDGLITTEEYKARKKEQLDRIQ